MSKVKVNSISEFVNEICKLTVVFSLTDKYYLNGKYYKVVAQILD